MLINIIIIITSHRLLGRRYWLVALWTNMKFSVNLSIDCRSESWCPPKLNYAYSIMSNALLVSGLGMLGIYVACAMQHCHLRIIVVVRSLFILHHVAACVRPDAAAWTRLSSGGNSSPQTARPVASPAQWSPGSSLDLWCK